MSCRTDGDGKLSGVHPAAQQTASLGDETAIWLIRHGETEWSKSGQHTGLTDIALTAQGEDQAKGLGPLLAGVGPAFVVCSPLLRARETARLAGLHVDTVDPNLAEWDYGAYEGLTTAEIRRSVPGWRLWSQGVPDGETIEEVGGRADRVLDLARAHLADGPVVLVSHGHISRVIGARWIGLDPVAGANLALGTAAPSLLGAQYGQPVIERWNMPNPAEGGR